MVQFGSRKTMKISKKDWEDACTIASKELHGVAIDDEIPEEDFHFFGYLFKPSKITKLKFYKTHVLCLHGKRLDLIPINKWHKSLIQK